MKRIVLIDGENLVYGLRFLLGVDGRMADRSAVDGFNFRGMLEEILEDNAPAEILWFGARLRIYDESEEIRIKSESAVQCSERSKSHSTIRKVLGKTYRYKTSPPTQTLTGQNQSPKSTNSSMPNMA